MLSKYFKDTDEQREYVNSTFKKAKEYVFSTTHRWSVIPCFLGTKKPVISWKEYQEEFPTMVELEKWFHNYEEPRNVAVITGKLSQLIILDLDEGFSTKGIEVPQTLITKTGSGIHCLYFAKSYKPIPKSCKVDKKDVKKVEIKGINSLCTLPPSFHENGNQYKWFWEHVSYGFKLEDAPKWMINYKSVQDKIEVPRRRSIKSALSKGLTQANIDYAREYPLQRLMNTQTTMVLCPSKDHNEKHPSFSINIKENYGLCFGCGYYCDSIKYVQDTLGLDFVSAVKRLL